MTLLCVSRLYFIPVHNPPQSIQMGSALVLVIQIIGVLPDVEGKEGAEAVGYGIIGVGVLGDAQLPCLVGLEPDPAGAEEGGAL